MRGKRYSGLKEEHSKKKSSFLKNTVAGISLFTLAAVGTTGCASLDNAVAKAPGKVGDIAGTIVSPADDLLEATGVRKGIYNIGMFPVWLGQSGLVGDPPTEAETKDGVHYDIPAYGTAGFEYEAESAIDHEVQKKLPLISEQNQIKEMILDATNSNAEDEFYTLHGKTSQGNTLDLSYQFDREQSGKKVVHMLIKQGSKNGKFFRVAKASAMKMGKSLKLIGKSAMTMEDRNGKPNDALSGGIINKTARAILFVNSGQYAFDNERAFKAALRNAAKAEKKAEKAKTPEKKGMSSHQNFQRYMK